MSELNKKQFELHIVSIKVEFELPIVEGLEFPAVEQIKMKHLFGRINDLVEKSKLYTDKELRIKQISQLLGTNDKYVSQAIRLHTGLMFSQYVDLFRIGLAVKMLTVDEYTSTMEVIAEAIGFNSTSTFYRNFKDVVGMAPTEFAIAYRSGDEKLRVRISKFVNGV